MMMAITGWSQISIPSPRMSLRKYQLGTTKYVDTCKFLLVDNTIALREVFGEYRPANGLNGYIVTVDECNYVERNGSDISRFLKKVNS